MSVEWVCRGTCAAHIRSLRARIYLKVWREPEQYPLHFVCMHISFSFKLYFLVVLLLPPLLMYCFHFFIVGRIRSLFYCHRYVHFSVHSLMSHVYTVQMYMLMELKICSGLFFTFIPCFTADHAHSNNTDENSSLFSVKKFKCTFSFIFFTKFYSM